MQPYDELVKAGNAFAMASPSELVAYLPDGGNVALDLSGLSGSLTARWFNPCDGKFEDTFKVEGGDKREF